MDNEELNFENLRKLDKEKLERVKLAIEIANHSNNQKLELKKYRIETVRILAVSIITSVLTISVALLTNYFNTKENRKERISTRKQESRERFYSLYDDYLNAADEDKVVFACAIRNIPNPENDSLVNVQIQDFEIVCEELRRTNKNLQKEIVNLVDENDISEKSKDKINNLEKEIHQLKQKKELNESDKKKLEIAEGKLDDLANENKKIADAVNSAEVITENQTVQLETIINSEKLNNIVEEDNLKEKEVKWFKKNYYLIFDNVKVILNKIENNERINVDICWSNETGQCLDTKKQDCMVSIYDPFVFELKNKRYELELVKIGKAGKNPFNKAAYISLIEK